METKHFDTIVVGLGLAGLAVTKRLEEKDKKALVISGSFSNASKIAGGVCNPVVLKKFNLAWNSQELFKNAVPFYKGLEKDLQELFFTEKPIAKIFKSVKEQNDWFSALGQPGLDHFLSEGLTSNNKPSLNAPYKMGFTKNTALLEVSNLLMAYQSYLENKKSFLKTDFNYSQLKINKEKIQYGEYTANNIIFCEGASVINNPYFNWLPIQGNKGEYITVKAEKLQLSEVVKGSFFIIPKGNNVYKFGATYNRHYTNFSPSPEAKKELTQKLQQMISCHFEVIEQDAGVRPTVPDRKPIIGNHPKHLNLHICNGFGSRGILFAPTISKQLVEAMYSGKEISKEINISRFYEDFEDASFL